MSIVTYKKFISGYTGFDTTRICYVKVSGEVYIDTSKIALIEHGTQSTGRELGDDPAEHALKQVTITAMGCDTRTVLLAADDADDLINLFRK